MAYIEDLSTETYCGWMHKDMACLSVGWLGCTVPTPGALAPRYLAVLRHYAAHHAFMDGLMGNHACEICGKGKFHGEFWIELFVPQVDRRVRFVLPMGVFHYIEAHGYCPPPEFLKAIEPLAVELEMEAALLPRAELPPVTEISALE
ncbi:MAG: hypothetical protein WAW39_17250 [Prosthecobacter sp.]|uniref:DUF7919 family protein n=1 Tax=Prosthecobacter sp. TaxID=1965333 RepID=UPI003BAFBBB8